MIDIHMLSYGFNYERVVLSTGQLSSPKTTWVGLYAVLEQSHFLPNYPARYQPSNLQYLMGLI